MWNKRYETERDLAAWLNEELLALKNQHKDMEIDFKNEKSINKVKEVDNKGLKEWNLELNERLSETQWRLAEKHREAASAKAVLENIED